MLLMTLTFVQDLPWMIEAENDSMDLMMNFNRNIIPPKEGKDIPAFVFIDVDEKTYHQWGEPLFMPRDRLKNLIKTSIDNEPRLVIVDIDVSQPALHPNDPIRKNYLANQLHPHDQALKDYLENYVADCKKKEDGVCTPIIFLRAFQANTQSDDLNSPPQPRIGFLEEAITKNAPYLQWASANFFHTEEDLVIRRWELWKQACQEEVPMVVPSIELAAMAKIQGCSIEETLEKLKPFQPENCNSINEQRLPEKFELCQLRTKTDIHNINQRINYQMSWLTKDISFKDNHLETQKEDEPKESVLTIFSAEEFSKEDSAKLKDSIVVIGSSYRDAKDIHLTPLGEMPGALVIINAIHTLLTLDEGVIKPLELHYRLLIIAILVIVITVLLEFNSVIPEKNSVNQDKLRFVLGSVWVMMLSGIFLISILFFPAIYLYEDGIWMDYTIPLLIVHFYHIINDFEELRKKIHFKV